MRIQLSGFHRTLLTRLAVLALLGSLWSVSSKGYAMSSYLSLCTAKFHERPALPPDSKSSEYVSIPDRQSLWLSITAREPGTQTPCRAIRLPVDSSGIAWARLLSDQQAATLNEGIILSSPNAQAPEPGSEIMPLIEPAAKSVGSNLTTGQKTPASPEIIQRKTLSTWLWQPQIWVEAAQNGLWAQLQDANIHQVFITIPLDKTTGLPREVEPLKAFIRKATEQGIAVWAVEGDPWFILSEERENALWRARAFNAYNQQASGSEKLAGVQYDIEPYLIPGFSLNSSQGYQAYLETVQVLKQAQQMPMDLVVPFWLTDAESGTVLEKLAPWADRVTVMDYRTNPTQIQAFAEPWLAWGERYGRKVQIALEAGPLPDETRFVYRPAPMGELWHILIGKQHALVLLNTPAKNPFGDSFAFSHKSPAPSAALTFDGHLRTLIDLIPDLQTNFARWPSYQGLALHQYLEISRTPPGH